MVDVPEQAVKAAAKSITTMRKTGKDSIQHPDFMFIEQYDCPYFYEESELYHDHTRTGR